MHLADRMIAILQSLLVMVMVLWFPFADRPKRRKLQRFTSSAARLAVYRQVIMVTLVVALAAVSISWPKNLFVVTFAKDDIPWLLGGPVRRSIATAIVGGFFVLYAAQILYFARNAAGRRKARPFLESMTYWLPVSDEERRWFALASINAGFSEEILCRGFLLQFLDGMLAVHTGMNLTIALLASSFIFGLGHLYQGAGGVAKAGGFGLIAGVTTILTGSLLWPIVLHALVDLAGLLVYRPQTDSPDDAASLIQGCDPDRLRRDSRGMSSQPSLEKP